MLFAVRADAIDASYSGAVSLTVRFCRSYWGGGDEWMGSTSRLWSASRGVRGQVTESRSLCGSGFYDRSESTYGIGPTIDPLWLL